jgi:hypothetical protein
MASTEREILEDMIGAAEAKIAAVEEALAFDRRYLLDLQTKRDALPSGRKAAAKKSPTTKGKGKKARPPMTKGSIEPGSLTDTVVKFFQEIPGQELRAAEIAKELTSRGVTTTSKNGLLPMVISTLSRRKDLFEKVGTGRYRLRESKG